MSRSRKALIRSRVSPRLLADDRGATLTEFGLISPVLFMMIMGIFDMAYGMYTTAMVNGAIQSAARNMTIEGATLREAQVDERLTSQVRAVVPAGATIDISKLSHFDFNDVGRAEEFTDTNGDGVCQGGESFVDVNGNDRWDANRGADGIGGARDVVLYTVTVTYERLFPIYNFIGIPNEATITGSTVLRNQPFDEQNRVTRTGNCP